MSNIDKRALREAATAAISAITRLNYEADSGPADADAVRAYHALAYPEAVLDLLDELEAKDNRDNRLEAQEHGRNPVLAYADSYRDMAKRGVESIPVQSVITDLERNIAPLFTAPPASVVNAEPAGYHIIIECGAVGCNVATLKEAEETRDLWNKSWTIKPYFYTAPPAPAVNAEPVAFINRAREPVLYGAHIGIAIGTNLYTAPPAPIEVEPVANEIVIPEAATHLNITEICPPGVNQTVFASGWNASRKSGMSSGRIPPIVKGIDAECMGWNACRAAMLSVGGSSGESSD